MNELLYWALGIAGLAVFFVALAGVMWVFLTCYGWFMTTFWGVEKTSSPRDKGYYDGGAGSAE